MKRGERKRKIDSSGEEKREQKRSKRVVPVVTTSSRSPSSSLSSPLSSPPSFSSKELDDVLVEKEQFGVTFEKGNLKIQRLVQARNAPRPRWDRCGDGHLFIFSHPSQRISVLSKDHHFKFKFEKVYFEKVRPRQARLVGPRLANSTDFASVIITFRSGTGVDQFLQVLRGLKSSSSIVPPIIGIDFGTSSCCVAFWKGGLVIPSNVQGNRTTSSYVSFPLANESVGQLPGKWVGEGAKNSLLSNPHNTIFNAKRLIGRRFDEQSVQSDKINWPFKILGGERNEPLFEVQVKEKIQTFTAEEISSIMLSKMKKIAETALFKKYQEAVIVQHAVVTVPGTFNFSQRLSIRNAGITAGFSHVRIIDEPGAAGLACAFDQQKKRRLKQDEERKMLIFNLGGGNFDIVLFSFESGVLNVIARRGDSHLGGEDFVDQMVNHFCVEFKKQDKDIASDKPSLMRLRVACESAKRALSLHTQAEINFSFRGDTISTSMTRSLFEKLNEDLFGKIFGLVGELLTGCKVRTQEIHDVVLVGGSTRIPKIQSQLREYLPGKELSIPISLEEGVAQGAAIQGAILGGEHEDLFGNLLLVETTSHSLGIETTGGAMSNVVPCNFSIPFRKSKTFTTSYNNQPSLNILVFEGEEKIAKDNNLLGRFTLKGIKLARRGVPQIEVSFELNFNSLVVSAKEISTGKNEEITITGFEVFSSNCLEATNLPVLFN